MNEMRVLVNSTRSVANHAGMYSTPGANKTLPAFLRAHARKGNHKHSPQARVRQKKIIKRFIP